MTHFASFNAMKPSMLQNADRCVFVGDLSFFCTELDLAEVFKRCGAISRLEVKRGRHGDSLLYAFVEFHERACAQIAIREMDGFKLLGRRMKVNWTDCKPAPTPGADQWVQVHVNFSSRNLSLKLSEEFLETIFIQFGNIGDIIVKRHSCSNAPSIVSGYAFIYFIDAYAAFRAIHGCKGINLDGVHFECALSRQYENAMSSQHGSSVPRGFKKPAHTSASSPAAYQQPPYHHQQGPSHYPMHARDMAPRGPSHYDLPPPHIHSFGGANKSSARRMPSVPATSSMYPIETSMNQRLYHQGSFAPQTQQQYPYTAGGRSPSMVATSFPEDYNVQHPYALNSNMHYSNKMLVNNSHNSSKQMFFESDLSFNGASASQLDDFAREEFLSSAFFNSSNNNNIAFNNPEQSSSTSSFSGNNSFHGDEESKNQPTLNFSGFPSIFSDSVSAESNNLPVGESM